MHRPIILLYVILQLMAHSMVDWATLSLTLAIGPATRTRAGVLTAEDYIRIQGIVETNDAVKTVTVMLCYESEPTGVTKRKAK